MSRLKPSALRRRIVATMLLVLGVLSCGGWSFVASPIAAEDEAGPRVVIKTITKLNLEIQEIAPPNLVVVATGEVPTGGWKNARLVRVHYDKPPADGVQDFILMAEKPTGIVTQVISEVTARYTIKGYEKELPWIKGVRIHGVDRGTMLKKLE